MDKKKLLIAITRMLQLYQKELMRLFTLSPQHLHPDFKREFITHSKQLTASVTNHTLSAEVAQLCHQMQNFLLLPRPPTLEAKPRKTSTQRAARNHPTNDQMMQAMQSRMKEAHRREVREIQQSYQLDPQIRRKWRDAYSRSLNTADSFFLLNRSIEKPTETMPQIQQSTHRLSLERPNKNQGGIETDGPKRRPMPFLF